MTDAEMQLGQAPADLRAARSESSEGRGLAKARRRSFLINYEPAERINTDVGPTFPGLDPTRLDEMLDIYDTELVASAADIGFWVAWHRAGGFEALERLGWNRATIFRKLKRFRARYGTHPDEWNPDWITLDLDRLWRAEVDFAINMREGLAYPEDAYDFGGVVVDDSDELDFDEPD